MNRRETLAAGLAASLAFAAPPLAAQGTFRLVVGTVTESRARTSSNDTSGRLVLRPTLEGNGLEEAKAFRIRVATAQDEGGASILPDEAEPARWEESASGSGLWIVLASPARSSATVTVTGTVDLWTPGRDPGAEVKVPKALARAGKSLVAKGLSDAAVALRLVAGEGSVGVAGKDADVERVRTLRLLRADGSEVPAAGLERSSDGAGATLELLLSEPPPADATLVLGLLTKKSVLAVPFELKDVPLP
jgi:hypothetical protein